MRAVILLAAGSSRRFGMANKLLARVAGEPLILRALAVAHGLPAGRILVVIGWQAARVARAARGPRVTVVRVRDHAEGLAASLRGGVRALRPCERAAFILLADMPWIDPALGPRLARALRPGCDGARPFWHGRPGHPLLARRALLDRAMALRGDAGLATLRPRIARLSADRRAIADIDRRRDGSHRAARR